MYDDSRDDRLFQRHPHIFRRTWPIPSSLYLLDGDVPVSRAGGAGATDHGRSSRPARCRRPLREQARQTAAHHRPGH